MWRRDVLWRVRFEEKVESGGGGRKQARKGIK